MATVLLTLARRGDALWIADMARRLVEIGLPWTWTPARVAHHICHRDSAVLTASAGSRPLGFGIMQYNDETAHLSLLAVEPLAQRKGLGKRMVQWLEETAITAGIFDVRLEVRSSNVSARNFYKKLGFTENSYLAGYYGGIEHAIRMSHDLRVPNVSTSQQ